MMSHWFETFDSAFFLSLTTIILACVTVVIRSIYKSKCENFSCCWGLLGVQRNVGLELQEDLAVLQHRPQSLEHEELQL